MHEDMSATIKLGIVVITTFCALLLLIGGAALAKEIDVRTNWEMTTAVVTDASAYAEVRRSVISTGKVSVPITVRSDVIQVWYTYTVDGREYTGVGKLDKSISVGAEISIAYDPDDHARSTIKSW